jgi:hypothetical protein
MNTPLPAHLVAGIRKRIAWLREAWQIDEIYAPPRLTGYPMAVRRREPVSVGGTAPTNPGATAPTFPQPHSNHARSRS